ncbi:MAG: metal-sulfur cluster assembly factor [Armatimonadota bacterium]|nr:metal-sulfur cluster assembly factor [Armatimonadota bacterium]MDR5703357.1 metal-sulfur cluster assembly factor [Armatimonadota bacterium]MDR7434254.1 metal-sulfur cluster assembly factor [Armatimonadota bacterium]
MVTKEQVIEVLKTCYDPEIPLNIWDLGLVYDIAIEGSTVNITMTLTAIGCPVGPWLAEDIRGKLLQLEGIEEVNVNFVWSPPWTPERLTPEGRMALQAMGYPV